MGDIEVRKSKQDGKAYIVAVEYDETGEPYYQKLKEVDSSVLEGPGNARGQEPGAAPDSQVPSFMSEAGGEAVPEPPRPVKPGAPIRPMPRNLEYVPPAPREQTPRLPVAGPPPALVNRLGAGLRELLGAPAPRSGEQQLADERHVEARTRTVDRGVDAVPSTMTPARAAGLSATAAALPVGLGNVMLDSFDTGDPIFGLGGEDAVPDELRAARRGVTQNRANPESMRGRLEQARSEQPDVSTMTDVGVSIAGPLAAARALRLAPPIQRALTPSQSAPTLNPFRFPLAAEVPAKEGGAIATGIKGVLKHGTLGAAETAATEAAYARPGERTEAASNPLALTLGALLPGTLGGVTEGARAHVTGLRNEGEDRLGAIVRNLEASGGKTSATRVAELPPGLSDAPRRVSTDSEFALNKVDSAPEILDAPDAMAVEATGPYLRGAEQTDEAIKARASGMNAAFYATPEARVKKEPKNVIGTFFKEIAGKDGLFLKDPDLREYLSEVVQVSDTVPSGATDVYPMTADELRKLGLDVPERKAAGADFIDAADDVAEGLDEPSAMQEPVIRRLGKGAAIPPAPMTEPRRTKRSDRNPRHPAFQPQRYERVIQEEIDPVSGLVKKGRTDADRVGRRPAAYGPETPPSKGPIVSTRGPDTMARGDRQMDFGGPDEGAMPREDVYFVTFKNLDAQGMDNTIRAIDDHLDWRTENKMPGRAPWKKLSEAARRDRSAMFGQDKVPAHGDQPERTWDETKRVISGLQRRQFAARKALERPKDLPFVPEDDSQQMDTTRVLAQANRLKPRALRLMLEQTADPGARKTISDIATINDVRALRGQGGVGSMRISAAGNPVFSFGERSRVRLDPVARAIGPTDLLAPHELTTAGIAFQRGRREEKKGEKPKKKNED